MGAITSQNSGIVTTEGVNLLTKINLKSREPSKKPSYESLHSHKRLWVGVCCSVEIGHLCAETSETYFAGFNTPDKVPAKTKTVSLPNEISLSSLNK